eukprot:Gb_00761 [translate_table: standard]
MLDAIVVFIVTNIFHVDLSVNKSCLHLTFLLLTEEERTKASNIYYSLAVLFLFKVSVAIAIVAAAFVVVVVVEGMINSIFHFPNSNGLGFLSKHILFRNVLFVVLAGVIIPNANANQSPGNTAIGINYGQIADNLPSPERVAGLLQSININKVKLYDADPKVLTAFANSAIEFVVGLGNEYLANMTDPQKAIEWVKDHVQSYLPATKITSIAVGNEVFTGNDTVLMTNLLPAMQNIHSALVNLGLNGTVNISTAHSVGVLGSSYPPSGGSLKPELTAFIRPLLDFLSQTGSPFLINAYPYFAYKDAPDQVSLDYVLFQPNKGMVDPATNLHYDNMLYAQIDAVYSALSALGYPALEVKVSETGWPSKGDPDEAGASPENARIYNGNLLQRLAQNQGTPMRPSLSLETYVFALFNENLKPGPTSERNYGLFKPDGSQAYNIGLTGSLSGGSTAISYITSSAKGKKAFSSSIHPGDLAPVLGTRIRASFLKIRDAV